MNAIFMSFSKAEFKFEYDATELAKEISKEICLRFGENEEEGFQEIVKKFIDELKYDMNKDLDNDESLNILALLEKINLDCFSVSYFSPQNQLGAAIVVKIPGLNEVINGIIKEFIVD